MEGNKFGKIVLAAILLIAAGAVASVDVLHYNAERDSALEEAHLQGMSEMYSSMTGMDLSAREVLRLHEDLGCESAPSA